MTQPDADERLQYDNPRILAAQRRTLWVLAISQIVGTVGVGVAPTIGILLAGDVTNSEAWAGLARTSSTLGAALLGFPLGTLAARRGRRVALSSGWFVAATGATLLVAAAQLSLVVPLFLGLLMIGAGSAVTLQARFAATDLASPANHAKSLALIVWVGTIGMVLGPNLGAVGEWLGRSITLVPFAAAFAIAAVFLALAGVVVLVFLRPDPLLLMGSPTTTPGPHAPGTRKRGGVRAVVDELRANASARYAVVTILCAQAVMVAIMTMTPVHIAHHEGSITIIGITISLHIVGMFAFAPLVGIATDRFGHRPTIAVGTGILLASLIIAILRPHSIAWIVVSLFLLGLGWSFANVAGSALFSAVIARETRATTQGGVDALSNLAGALAAFVAGPLLAVTSFAWLAGVAVVLLIPMAVLAIRRS